MVCKRSLSQALALHPDPDCDRENLYALSHFSPEQPRTPSRSSSPHLQSEQYPQFTPSTEYSFTSSPESTQSDPESERKADKNMGNGAYDARAKLRDFNIIVDSEKPMPQELKIHLENVIEVPRDRSAPSPAAKRLYHDTKAVVNAVNEATGISILEENLLFKPEYKGGEKHIWLTNEAYLNTAYLPQAPSPEIKSMYGDKLTQPIVDTAVGYISCVNAGVYGLPAPLTEGEERMIRSTALSETSLLPFLTCQWKCPNGNDSILHAQNQSARDGTAIVNHLHDLYDSAKKVATAVDTCHWSLTTNMMIVMLWVHWRDDDKSHHMRLVEQAFLRDFKDPENIAMVNFRSLLRNILDYSVGERLQNIKAVISQIDRTNTTKRRKT